MLFEYAHIAQTIICFLLPISAPNIAMGSLRLKLSRNEPESLSMESILTIVGIVVMVILPMCGVIYKIFVLPRSTIIERLKSLMLS
jgi:hypothetical protein